MANGFYNAGNPFNLEVLNRNSNNPLNYPTGNPNTSFNYGFNSDIIPVTPVIGTSNNPFKGSLGIDLNNQTIDDTTNQMRGLVADNGGILSGAKPDNGGLFGLSNNTLAGIGLGLQGLSGLANAFMSYKNYKLAKNQWRFQKNLANRNLANQAKTVNNAYDNAAQVAAGMIGGQDASGNYGFTDQAIVDRYANRAKNQHVDGSPIK